MASVFELAQQINRQKQQGQGGGNQYFDNSMRVMEHLEERSKEGTARKVKGMEVALGDFSKVYDNTTLTDRMDVFEKRFGGNNLNKLNADERAAYDNAKIMMSRQMEKNTDFSMYQNKLKDTTKAMNDWMTSADGDTQPDPDTMNQILLDYMDTRANFSTTHQDRLSSQAFSYLNKEMDSIHEMGTFGIASMSDDGILSEGEAKAMAQSLTTLDPTHISEFKKNRDATEADGYKANVTAMDNDMKLYKGYQDIKNRIHTNDAGEIGYYEGGDEDKFVRMSHESVDDTLYGIKKRLGNLDNRYQQSRFNEEGKSYLEMAGFNEGKSPLPGDEKQIGETFAGTIDPEEEIGETEEVEELQPKVEGGKTKFQQGKDFILEAYNDADEATDGTSSTVLGIVTVGTGLYNSDNILKAANTFWKSVSDSKDYLSETTGLNKKQISTFLESDQVKNTTKKLDSLDSEIRKRTKKLSQTSSKGKPLLESQIKALKKQRDRIMGSRSKYWAKKFNLSESKINSLWDSKNLKKWNTFKLRDTLTKGKLGGVFKLGQAGLIGDIVMDKIGVPEFTVFTGAAVAEGVKDVTAGFATQKAAKGIGGKLMKMAKSPAGRAILKRVAGKQTLKKIATGAVAGGGWLSAITAVVGTGLAVKDIYDAVNEWNESELTKEEK